MAGRQPIAILLETADFAVLDKPAGLPVTPGRGGGPSVEGWLATGQPKGRDPQRAVHRLDQDTSGCLLVARRARALRGLAEAFARGEVRKVYLALVRPGPEQPEGIVEAPLAKRSTRRAGWRMVMAADGKPSLTRWRSIGRSGDHALLAFLPATGRTHQLRVHAQALGRGCAIIGDPVYGRGEAGGLMLHAAALDFEWKGRRWTVSSPLPDRFPAWARDAADGQLDGLLTASEAIMASAIRPGSGR